MLTFAIRELQVIDRQKFKTHRQSPTLRKGICLVLLCWKLIILSSHSSVECKSLFVHILMELFKIFKSYDWITIYYNLFICGDKKTILFTLLYNNFLSQKKVQANFGCPITKLPEIGHWLELHVSKPVRFFLYIKCYSNEFYFWNLNSFSIS